MFSRNGARFRSFPPPQHWPKRYALDRHNIFLRGPCRNPPDTGGQPPSAAIGVSIMPTLKAPRLRKPPQEKVLLERCSGLATSINVGLGPIRTEHWPTT